MSQGEKQAGDSSNSTASSSVQGGDRTVGENSKERQEYAIDIFRDWCKQCGICAAFCPRECIRQDEEGTPIVEDSGRCSGCGWCELHCPDFAISVRRKMKKMQAEE